MSTPRKVLRLRFFRWVRRTAVVSGKATNRGRVRERKVDSKPLGIRLRKSDFTLTQIGGSTEKRIGESSCTYCAAQQVTKRVVTTPETTLAEVFSVPFNSTKHVPFPSLSESDFLRRLPELPGRGRCPSCLLEVGYCAKPSACVTAPMATLWSMYRRPASRALRSSSSSARFFTFASRTFIAVEDDRHSVSS